MTLDIDKLEQIKTAAENLFATGPEWVTFYREVMGLQGLIRRVFPNNEAMDEFEQTETYREIQRMVAELRKRPIATKPGDEKVITVRIPKCMHDALRIEAYELRTSMNKLCISKLLQAIDVANVPGAFDEKTQPEDVPVE
jgi:predicted HicB family RNase H-like nuclease